ncbi:PfkB family carbohydrate kinase [Mycoplasma hafezii]|uniref:PfkB family carbohydrate kinase n=1 Tax=Mycoplasma hafezii TaxID=525886 RepID=UPI003CEB4178
MNKKEKEEFYFNKLELMKKIANTKYYSHFDSTIHNSQVEINHKLALESPYYPKIHIRPYSGLLNDPNGLVYHDGYYYIFYQNTPNIAMHKTKCWSAYRTMDFLVYEDLGTIITPSIPEDAQGIFSGGAISAHNKIYLYYTGNTKKYFADGTFERGSSTIVVEYNPEKNTISEKKVLFSVDKNIYTGEFRDPFPFKKGGKYYLIHGAQTKEDKKGVLSVYASSTPNGNFERLGDIKFTNFKSDEAYMYECPVYFKLEDKDVISFSTQGQKYYKDQAEKNDYTIFLIGKMNWKTLEFKVQNVQQADLGFDFYAGQIFNNVDDDLFDDEVLYLGWAAKPQDHAVATFDHGYANHLSFVRKLSLMDDQIIQEPLWIDDNYNPLKGTKVRSGILKQRHQYWELRNKESFSIRLFNEKNDELLINYSNETLTVDRSNMSVLESIETTQKITQKINIYEIKVLLDNSFIELFINDGEAVFSSKYYINGTLGVEFLGLQGKMYPVNEMEFVSSTKKHQSNPLVNLPGEALIDEFKQNDHKTLKVGGAPINVCGAIGLLNSNADFLGAIGDDENGNLIKNYFFKNNLSTSELSVLPKTKTTIAHVTLDENGERSFEFTFGADQQYTYDDYLYIERNVVFSSATAFLKNKLNKTYDSFLNSLTEYKEKFGFFDPNYRDALFKNKLAYFKEQSYKYIQNVHVVKLSEEEYQMLYNNTVENILNDKFSNEHSALDEKNVLITLGEKGTLAIYNRKYIIVPSVKTKVVDTTGAGDSFFGFFIAQFLEQYDNHDAMKNLNIEDLKYIILKANICASFVVSKFGAIESLPTLEEIEQRFNEFLVENEPF